MNAMGAMYPWLSFVCPADYDRIVITLMTVAGLPRLGVDWSDVNPNYLHTRYLHTVVEHWSKAHKAPVPLLPVINCDG